jgi:hypothetical protein
MIEVIGFVASALLFMLVGAWLHHIFRKPELITAPQLERDFDQGITTNWWNDFIGAIRRDRMDVALEVLGKLHEFLASGGQPGTVDLQIVANLHRWLKNGS